MSKRLWYLSGGMTAFGKDNFEESNVWRVRLQKYFSNLSLDQINLFNPNAHWSMLDDPEEFTDREAMNLDIYKLRNSELVIYGNNDPYSRGSMIELGIAYERRIPIFVLNFNNNEIHCWVKEISERIFNSEKELVDYLNGHYVRID